MTDNEAVRRWLEHGEPLEPRTYYLTGVIDLREPQPDESG